MDKIKKAFMFIALGFLSGLLLVLKLSKKSSISTEKLLEQEKKIKLKQDKIKKSIDKTSENLVDLDKAEKLADKKVDQIKEEIKNDKGDLDWHLK